jgi:hypothetical protein
MPYRPNPPEPPDFDSVAENVADWVLAPSGKWFIGVIDTDRNQMFVVPVNVFEGRGALDQNTLNNASQRGMNRYASGVPADRTNGLQTFHTFSAANWLEARGAGNTHHTEVARHYGCDPQNCLGFTLIKLTPGGDFAQLKCSSNSLNLKPGQQIVRHNFSLATFLRAHPPAGGPVQNPTGSCQMPDVWTKAIVTFFSGYPFGITHMAVSND